MPVSNDSPKTTMKDGFPIMIILVISYKNKIKRWGTLSNLEKFSIFTTIVGFVIITLINILRLLNIINFKNRS